MSPQAGWILQEEIVPRLRSAIPRTVNCVGSEDHAELIQDATVMAARMIDRVEGQGKLGTITASNIAYYTIQHCKSGRRANGTSSVDIMGSSTQLNGTSRLHSLNEVVAEDEAGCEIFELQDVLSNDHEDPGMVAARKLDWDRFLDQLSHVEQLVIEFLSAGKTLRDVARQVGLSDSAMQGYRRKIGAKVLEFFGIDVLVDLGIEPSWRINLDCTRAAQACRYERRALA
jgi:hypothetical protein